MLNEVKLAFSENKLAIYISIAILFISLILGYILEPYLFSYLNPVVEDLTQKVQSGVIKLTFTDIFFNNIEIVFRMFIYGLCFCLSVVVLSFNGFFVGYYLATSNNFWYTVLLIVPHGIFEFSSCILACASGLVLFNFVYKLLKAIWAHEETSVKEEPVEPVKGLRPRFMTGESDVKAADRGSATHIFLQFADFAGLAEHGAEYELDRLVKTRHLSAKLADMVNMNQLKRFVRSDLMDKIRRSPMVRREFRFNTRMPAEQFTADEAFREKLRGEGVKITVQGVVDCVFRDPDSGRLVLVDYKTDSLSAEEWQDRARACKKLTDRHRNQLLYYRGICGKMFGEKIAETLIYSTVLGECIAVE